MEIFIAFENRPLLFSRPHSVVTCHHPSGLDDAFRKLEHAVKDGFYAAGFVSYEAGYCFEERLREERRYDFPLLQMGIYDRPQNCRLPVKRSCGYGLDGLRLNISRDDYGASIDEIRRHIACGDVYQITYCVKLHFRFRGEPLELYHRLLRAQPVPYPAYISTDKFHILSLSPERFIKKRAGSVTTEPMKGTWPRGRTVFSDAAARFRFSRDIKNRSENVMIADLLRNDLGRVGKKIRAPKLFTVTGYRTLFQMTSTVTGKVRQDMPLCDLFAALFPSGSVTGAPKIRAMEIIRGLETEERKIYTGAIGYMTPQRDMYFNIPIRTILLTGEDGEMGVGGGIVWDSTAQGEWDEGLLKARFLTDMASAPLINP